MVHVGFNQPLIREGRGWGLRPGPSPGWTTYCWPTTSIQHIFERILETFKFFLHDIMLIATARNVQSIQLDSVRSKIYPCLKGFGFGFFYLVLVLIVLSADRADSTQIRPLWSQPVAKTAPGPPPGPPGGGVCDMADLQIWPFFGVFFELFTLIKKPKNPKKGQIWSTSVLISL